MKQINYILFFLVFIATTACINTEECRKDKTVNLEIGIFEKKKNTTTNTYSLISYSVDSLTVRAISTDGKLIDSILYNNSKKISKLYLPLNKFSTISKYLVEFNKTKDTITVLHSNTNQFLSLECGCIKTHSIDTVLTTNHFIDSVKIDNHIVNTTKNLNAQHIRIFN